MRTKSDEPRYTGLGYSPTAQESAHVVSAPRPLLLPIFSPVRCEGYRAETVFALREVPVQARKAGLRVSACTRGTQPVCHVLHQLASGVEGDTVVVFGAGPVGIMAARCAWLFGAGQVIVIDCLDYRLGFASKYAPCEAYDFRSLEDPVVFVKGTTDSLAADVCIDAVGADIGIYS